ncbi:MAG: hypothetical protein JEY94_07655 [Melioribacteraceae bacterium]|nr:hypothetical protein [Melioribacteraceae bacterium]
MKAQSKSEIIFGFEEYFKDCVYNQWCIGTAGNISETLFEKLKISRRKDDWIFKITSSKITADEIKQYFITQGMNKCHDDDGGNAKIVFAFRKLTNGFVEK